MPDSESAVCALEILKLLVKNRGYYNKYVELIQPYIQNKSHKVLLAAISDYYTNFSDHNYISEDDFRMYVNTNYSHLKNSVDFELLIDGVYALDLSSDTIQNYVHRLIERGTYRQISYIIQDALLTDTYNKISDIEEVISKYRIITSVKDSDSPFTELDLVDYAKTEEEQRGFRWRLQCLNRDCGNLTGATLTHVFAYPNVGKTSFLASEVSYMASQLEGDDIIVWVNNEQAIHKVKERVFESILNARKEDLLQDLEKAQTRFKERNGKSIKLVDGVGISIEYLRELCSNYPIRLLIVDQGDKISFKGCKDLEGHLKLKTLYVMFRELAKEFDIPIITVGQASADAVNKKWLTMDMTENSKVGKAAEMDLEIGIGKSGKDDEEHMRFLHICKNKQTGIHGKHIVYIDQERARYKDIV